MQGLLYRPSSLFISNNVVTCRGYYWIWLFLGSPRKSTSTTSFKPTKSHQQIMILQRSLVWCIVCCSFILEQSPLASHLGPADLITGVNDCKIRDQADWMRCMTHLPGIDPSTNYSDPTAFTASQLLDLMANPTTSQGMALVLSLWLVPHAHHKPESLRTHLMGSLCQEMKKDVLQRTDMHPFMCKRALVRSCQEVNFKWVTLDHSPTAQQG